MKWHKITITTIIGSILEFGGVTSANSQNQPIGMNRAAASTQDSMNAAIPLEIEFNRAQVQEAYAVDFANDIDV